MEFQCEGMVSTCCTWDMLGQGGSGKKGQTRFLQVFLSQNQHHLYADAGTDGKSTLVLSIQPPKQSAQLQSKGSVSPSLHTGSI